MQIILDTNFLLTCAKQKIDFVSIANEKIGEEIKWIVPNEVISELKELSSRPGLRGKDKDSAKLAIELLNITKPELVYIKNRNVDEGIVQFSKNKDIIIATLDKKLKSRIQNKILVIKDFKDLEII
jgi:rRNA-processing protein FCF1